MLNVNNFYDILEAISINGNNILEKVGNEKIVLPDQVIKILKLFPKIIDISFKTKNSDKKENSDSYPVFEYILENNYNIKNICIDEIFSKFNSDNKKDSSINKIIFKHKKCVNFFWIIDFFEYFKNLSHLELQEIDIFLNPMHLIFYICKNPKIKFISFFYYGDFLTFMKNFRFTIFT